MMMNNTPKQTLGDRMKQNYEDKTRIMLPRRGYTIIRIDGKAFSSLTSGLDKPIDLDFAECMHYVASNLKRHMQGSKFIYQQSDEISVILTDFDSPQTDAWYDNNLQKICSVSASLATYFFNEALASFKKEDKLLQVTKPALFDARVFNLPSFDETVNYLRWRQRDCIKNATSNLALSVYSHKDLLGKNTTQREAMALAKGASLDDYPGWFKYGFSYSDMEHEDDLDFTNAETIKLLGDIIPKLEVVV